MFSMGLSFMAEKAGIGRKPEVLTFWSIRELATIWPQMGIDVFAASKEQC
jgi:hypothetical protein